MRCRIESVGAALPVRGTHYGADSVELAVDASRACLDTSCHPVYEVGYLVNTGVYHSRHTFTPAFAAFIQNRLGMNTDFMGRRTLSFDISNGASGMLSGIKVVISAINSGAIRLGMVVSSEPESYYGGDKDPVYGASGSALIIDISPDNTLGFGSFAFRTFDEYSGLYHGFMDPMAGDARACITTGDDLEEVYCACASEVLAGLLETEKIQQDELDLVFASQISLGFLHRLAGRLGMPPEKIVNVLRILKMDTLTTSPFIALDYALKNGMVRPGMKIAFISVGSGITVGTAVYYA